MNLILKVLIVAVVIIAALIGFRYLVPSSPQHISSSQAVSNITNYIKTTNPGAAVNITSINASQYAGSWQIVASVITNGTRACPSFYVYSFDYPQYGFVSRLVNNYTSNCIINERQGNNSYAISSYPIAIVRSYDINASNARSFVVHYGYPNVLVHAQYLSSILASGRNYSGVWQVNYTNTFSNSSLSVLISSQNGTLVSTSST